MTLIHTEAYQVSDLELQPAFIAEQEFNHTNGNSSARSVNMRFRLSQ